MVRRHGLAEREIVKVQEQFGVAEILLPPNSTLINRTLKEGRFREKFNLSVIGVRRQNTPLSTEFAVTQLAAGDTLLLAGSWEHIRKLESRRDLVVLETTCGNAKRLLAMPKKPRLPSALCSLCCSS
ncbi:MAG: TrkA C-terminal domain-containing protein [Nitrincola sp.]|nr:TrkA C-terminal domain-containing protein [Nitrincola sp.]